MTSFLSLIDERDGPNTPAHTQRTTEPDHILLWVHSCLISFLFYNLLASIHSWFIPLLLGHMLVWTHFCLNTFLSDTIPVWRHFWLQLVLLVCMEDSVWVTAFWRRLRSTFNTKVEQQGGKIEVFFLFDFPWACKILIFSCFYAMSSPRILVLQKVRRVRLFAD